MIRKDLFLPGDEWVFAAGEEMLERAIAEAFAEEPKLQRAGPAYETAFREILASA